MNVRSAFTTAAAVLMLASAGCGTGDTFPELRGDYLGQTPPEMIPERFAEGAISTGLSELNAVFNEEGDEFWYSLVTPGAPPHYTIMVSHRVEGVWREPIVAPFSGTFSDADPFLTADGSMLYYVSNRPVREGEEGGDYDIWRVRRIGDSWGEPEHLGDVINTPGPDYYPTLSEDGTLYYSCNRGEGTGFGANDIHRAEPDGQGGFLEPVNLGAGVNAPQFEADVLVAPDERWVVFVSFHRPGGVGHGDLYISYRDADGEFGPARNLGEPFNSPVWDYCPMLSPDGDYFFFTSFRRDPAPDDADGAAIRKYLSAPGNGLGDIYWVRSEALEMTER